MKLALVTALCGRPIEAIFTAYYSRLAHKAAAQDIDVALVAAINVSPTNEDLKYLPLPGLLWGAPQTSQPSPKTDHPWELVVAELGGKYSVTRSLGGKFNAALSHPKVRAADAIIVVGSDDFLPADCFSIYAMLASRYPLWSPSDIYIVDALTGRACYWESPACGVGRMIRADVLRHVDYKLWGDVDRGLEASMAKTVLKTKARWMRHRGSSVGLGPMFDVKTETNLWGYERFVDRATPVSLDTVLSSHVELRGELAKLYPALGGP